MKKFNAIVAWMLVCLAIAGCTNRGGGGTTSAQNEAIAKLASFAKDAAQTQQTYHAMDNAALLDKLAEQSKARVEPFNSPAYRELEQRTDIKSSAIVAMVRENTNAGGLLPLLLLRKLERSTYLELPVQLRASILTGALQTSKYFNVWGLPNFYLEDASRAMIEAGRGAAPALRRMLVATRQAPVFGSQEYMVYKRYQYRLCDYALFFLERIAGNTKFSLPLAPAERDMLIKQMMAP